jgi:predicted adenine nucleotide alpha hydrolase (AANH) superfamily ATPase
MESAPGRCLSCLGFVYRCEVLFACGHEHLGQTLLLSVRKRTTQLEAVGGSSNVK